ncbi:MAG: hypothetical protein QQN41_04825 [Nitrosopumilus sp.]
MAQFSAPISDITLPASWNGTFADIDESVASDVDFGWSDDNADDAYETKFDVFSDPLSDINHTVRCRISRSDGGVPNNNSGSAASLLIELIQGTTIIATVRNDANVGLWEDVSYTLTGIEADSITDYTDLRIRFTYTGGGGSPANRRGVAVSWTQKEVPDAVTPPIEISGQSSGSSTPSGSATKQFSISGRSISGSSSSANIKVTFEISGQSLGLSTPFADITFLPIQISGQSLGSSSAQGNATKQISINGQSLGNTSSSLGLKVVYEITGSSNGNSVSNADITFLPFEITGQSIGSSISSANATILKEISGQSNGVSVVSCYLKVIYEISGQSLGKSISNANASLLKEISGSSVGNSTSQGNIILIKEIFGQSSGISISSANIILLPFEISGQSLGLSTVSLLIIEDVNAVYKEIYQSVINLKPEALKNINFISKFTNKINIKTEFIKTKKFK